MTKISKYKIDRDRDITHGTDINIKEKKIKIKNHQAIFARSKMSALKSYRYVKTTTNNNDLAFCHEI